MPHLKSWQIDDNSLILLSIKVPKQRSVAEVPGLAGSAGEAPFSEEAVAVGLVGL